MQRGATVTDRDLNLRSNGRLLLNRCIVGGLVVLSVIAGANAVAAEREWGKNREIVKVSEHVYRWGSDNQYGAYIVGEDAIAVVDGHYCPSGTMPWLKAEIAKRHDQPVRYVVLSHDHTDHICNSDVFKDTAIGVGQRKILPHILREGRPSIVPQITFDDQMQLDLGGVVIDLMYLGPSHSDNLIQVHIPVDKVLIAIDMAKGKSIFPDFRDMDVHSTLDMMATLEHLPNVEIVLPGHGPITDQSTFHDERVYLQALHDEVLEHMVAGRSLPEILELVTMDEFSDYERIDIYLDANIATMWEYLYRYREPNQRITPEEALACRLDIYDCRTTNIEE